MYVIIDNYDSFVYNLAVYFQELNCKVEVIRNDQIEIKGLEQMVQQGEVQGIIVSPGPKNPKDCGNSGKIVRQFAGRVPILGVCLGHQIIGFEFGAKIQKGKLPMHGKVESIINNGKGLFKGLPRTYQVTRYHSLVVSRETLPDCLLVDATAEDGSIQAMHHIKYPIYGVQFHPEAVLTQYGHKLLYNYIKICEEMAI
ncbi:MAG: aminodeoxychorismate/anthranilate synthase component II [Anaerostipes sp.]|nr:aminodeoxychorismate/anthranilate synthase component II [Anaerostipes sp.]